jgi:phosphatidylglycerol---prolipoprotein diacylglyceryl transferase
LTIDAAPRGWLESDAVQRRAYSVMLGVGSVAGVTLGAYWAARQGVPVARVQVAMVLLFLPALFGARLLFVFSNWRSFRLTGQSVVGRSQDGAALYGGLAVSLVLSVPLLALFRIPLGVFWDAMVVAMLVGLAFTRVGCTLHGCCAGRASTRWFAVRLPGTDGRHRRFPTQMIESAVAVGTLVVVFGVAHRSLFVGGRSLLVFAIYGVARFFLEGKRESIDLHDGRSVHRMISVGLVAISTLAFGGIVLLR